MLVVAHRLSTIQRADWILVLHHGELRDQDTHQQFLARRDLYWRLYQLQDADDSRDKPSPMPNGIKLTPGAQASRLPSGATARKRSADFLQC